jgi:hypothetical protein
MKKENREYKSDVFSMLMEDKANALEVYNALNGSAYDDPEQVEIVTLQNAISLSIRNDAAFIVDTDINIYEHQSSFNPNMPLRALKYYATILDEMIENRDLFASHLIKIPTPHFVVFYNGVCNRPIIETMKLSDSFEKPADNPEVELICTVHNINPDKDKELLAKSAVLDGYTTFVESVRKFKNDGSKYPIEDAIEYCISNHILEKFLKERRSEVEKNMTIDMTFERREVLIRKEEREEGRKEGRKEGREEDKILLIQKKIAKNKTLDIIASEMETTIEEIKPIYDVVIKYPTDTNPEKILSDLR